MALAAVGCAGLCVAARRRPGPWRPVVARLIGLALLADAVSYSVGLAVQGTWSPKTSLPLALCDAGVLVAAAACWWRTPVLVELTYFWGLAGTLQAVVTPDLNVGFPHLVFFQYVVGHLGIVAAALFLVAGCAWPPGAAPWRGSSRSRRSTPPSWGRSTPPPGPTTCSCVLRRGSGRCCASSGHGPGTS